MAILAPFRALRPLPAAAGEVAAVPYDVVSTEEARALAEGHPLSFLRVSRPEIELPAGTDPHADAVYARAAANFARLRAAAPLVEEARPSLYVYRLHMGAHVQTGVAGCFAVDDYDAGTIRKHERTRPDKEDDRTRHVIALRAQTGPVLLTYKARAAVAAVVGPIVAGAPPLLDVTAADGVRHEIWQVPADADAALVEAFGRVPALYIADGHHRAASASRARQHFRGAAGTRGPWDGFLAVAFPDDQMQVLPYNRVVKDLEGHTPASLVTAVSAVCRMAEGSPTPPRAGVVSMFVDGRWHAIDLGTPPAGLPPDERLDVSRLQALVLGPVLKVGDPRTDPRIEFVGGARGTAALEALVQSGRAAVAFSLVPVGVDDLMAVSDAGGIMPPKSTWFEPKLRDGLLSHSF